MSAKKQHEMIERHMPLVRSIAGKVLNQIHGRAEYEDLIAYGQEGLVQAADRFDPSKGVAFSTFAYYRIRGAMFDGLRKMGNVIHIRDHRVAFAQRADEYVEELSREPPPPDAEAAAERLVGALSDLAVAYVIASEDVGDRADTTTPDPGQVTEAHEELSLARRLVTTLPERERELISLMYFEGMTMLDAAKRLGMSKGWASRLHARALQRMRRAEPPLRSGSTPMTLLRV